MPLSNTPQSYGAVARLFHWLTALLILTAIPLGLIANDMAFDTSDALAAKAQLFSLHKSVGVAAFTVALLRVLWAFTQPRPVALHPERRAETMLAEVAHWLLYISMLIVPLSGWIGHAASTGFAPILLPIGQDLPFVPKSPLVAEVAGALHWLFTKILIGTIVLHILGALKHHLFDRDATLMRMVTGSLAGNPLVRHRKAPALMALAIYAAGAGIAVALMPAEADAPGTGLAAVASGWTVTEGTLAFGVRQMGADVQGSFADWTAAIQFDEAVVNGKHGTVTVTIATDSLTVGSVTTQAKTADFFDTAAHPTAIFTGDILPADQTSDQGYIAQGTLTLRGVEKPVTLPFALVLDANTAKMKGTTTLDRRDYGMGATYTNESSVGFPVVVTVTLTATRTE